MNDEYDPTPNIVDGQDFKDYEEYNKKIEHAKITVGYAVEDGRLEPQEAEIMTNDEMINFANNEKDYDPY